MSDPASSTAAEPLSLWKRLMLMLRGEDESAAAMRESLAEVVEQSERESPALSLQERVMLGNLLRFGDLRVIDVMVPRADIIAAEETITLAELMKIMREAQHSRLPLYRETLDDPTGLIHVKDVMALLEPSPEGAFCIAPNASITALRRPILFAPPSMRALDLMVKMQASHTHLALVIDEYGGTDGLVSIEDLIEEIVGDISDEHDEVTAELKPEGDGYSADARMDLEDFKAETGHDLMFEDADEDVDSLGGLVTSLLGRVPQRGEIVAHPNGYEFLVLDADPRRVRRLRIRLPRDAGADVPKQGGPKDGDGPA
ncbi:MAG: HlyC/CorC family transporter [Alphaproteobacteria bacterium]|nr:HlyC/CorC family transporter [Alphaproteobacteria bacterium]